MANTTVKLSILHLYIRIFPDPIFRKMCYITAALSLAYFVMVFAETFAFCRPISYNWDKSIEGRCIDPTLAYLFAGITNFFLEVIIVILPMPMLWRLRMSVTKKLGTSAMFSLGALSVFPRSPHSQYQISVTNLIRICIISLIRVIHFRNLDLDDLMYNSADWLSWSLLEPALGVVNACLPVMMRTWLFRSKPDPGSVRIDRRQLVTSDPHSKRNPQVGIGRFGTTNPT